MSFRTHRGLLRHNAAVHKLLPQDPAGRPFIQNNPSIPSGFNDLAFIDFSCKKFTHIAQVPTPAWTRPDRTKLDPDRAKPDPDMARTDQIKTSQDRTRHKLDQTRQV